jgi:hypothetical protein
VIHCDVKTDDALESFDEEKKEGKSNCDKFNVIFLSTRKMKHKAEIIPVNCIWRLALVNFEVSAPFFLLMCVLSSCKSWNGKSLNLSLYTFQT